MTRTRGATFAVQVEVFGRILPATVKLEPLGLDVVLTVRLKGRHSTTITTLGTLAAIAVEREARQKANRKSK